MANNRYAGISPFTSTQSNIFFGRDKDIEELYEQILLEKQVLLYAKSGIGKSSLVNAGVIPKLDKDGEFKTITIRFRAYNKKDFVTPIERIVNELKNIKVINLNDESILEQIEADEEQTLWFYFKKIQLLNPDIKIVLIFDQFEELFSYPKEQVNEFKIQLSEILKPEVPDTFVDLFAEARRKDRKLMSRANMSLLNKNLQTKAVYIIRSDRLSELNHLRDRIPDIQKSYYELKALDKKQAEEAIVNPAINEGEFDSPTFEYTKEALEKILKYLTKNYEQNIETTQLQIVCQRIENNIPRIDKKHEVSVNDIPDFKNIFFEFYNNSIGDVTQQHQEEARKLIENELIRNKQRISLDGRLCTDYLPEEELQKLVNNHLLRAERNSVGSFSFELSHDTLIEPIHEAAEERRHKEEEAKAQAEREEELRIARKKAEQERIEREKEKKRQRQITMIVSIAAVVSVAFGVFGFVNMSKAESNLESAIKYQVSGKKRDAISAKQNEIYDAALTKYKELLDIYRQYPQYEFDSIAVYKDIKECNDLDSISDIFYPKFNIADSLIKLNEIEDLKNARLLFEQLDSINYKPGKEKLKNKRNTHQIKVNNLIEDKLRLAEMQINAGLKDDARKTVVEIENLDPGNSKIKEFKEQYAL